MEAAIALFSKNGYYATSVQDIANFCQVSQTTIFYHFKTKKLLFKEVLNYVIANNRSIFNQVDHSKESPLELLQSLLKSNVDWCYHYPEQTKMLLLLFQFAAVDDEMNDLATETIETGINKVEQYLNGTVPKFEIDSRSMAIIIQQYVNGVLFQMLARNDIEKVYQEYCKNIGPYLNSILSNRDSI